MKKPIKNTKQVSNPVLKPKEKSKRIQNQKHISMKSNNMEQQGASSADKKKNTRSASKKQNKKRLEANEKQKGTGNVSNYDNQVASSTLACSSPENPSKQHPAKNKQQNVESKQKEHIAKASKKIVKNKGNKKQNQPFEKKAKALKNANKQGNKKSSAPKDYKNTNLGDNQHGTSHQQQTQITGSTQPLTLIPKDVNNLKESTYSNIKSLIGGMGAFLSNANTGFGDAQQNKEDQQVHAIDAIQGHDNQNFGGAQQYKQIARNNKIAYNDSNFSDKQNHRYMSQEALLKKQQLAQIQQAQEQATIIAKARENESQNIISQALKNLIPNFGGYNTEPSGVHNQLTQQTNLPYKMAAQTQSPSTITNMLDINHLNAELMNEPTFSKLQQLMMLNNVTVNQDIHQKLLTALAAQAQKQQQLKAANQNLNFSSRYQIIKEAGKGAFGSVYKAEDTQLRGLDLFDPRKYVAIKKLFYDRQYEQRELSTLDEIKKKKLCSNIIELKDRYFQNIDETTKDPDTKQNVTVSKEYLFIVTDYLPFTICDLRLKDQPKEHMMESIKQVMHGLFKGLNDLHSLGITHRDLKLSNILIDNNQYPVNLVKICDLGSSKKLISDPNDESTQSLNYIGTRSFRAPELLVGNRYYNNKIDIWSAGIVFLKLVLKYVNKKVQLFEAKNTNHLCKIVMEYIGEPTSVELKEMLATSEKMSGSIKQGISDEDILRKRFKKLDQILKNQVPQDCIDLIHQIFQLSPVRRISAKEALQHPYFIGSKENDDGKMSMMTKQSMIKNRTTEATSPCTNNNLVSGQAGHSTQKQYH